MGDGVGVTVERLRELRARRARLDAEELALLAEIAVAVGDDRGVGGGVDAGVADLDP